MVLTYWSLFLYWGREAVVKYMLFQGEATLSEPIAGTSEFAKEFAARGPFDSKGRSLREFDLKSRMFRYPMSYTIYSRQFDGLATEAKERIYLRLWEVLTGADTSGDFEHISKADRQAIIEIIRDTKRNLPTYWTE
jgi:hypothetical protein